MNEKAIVVKDKKLKAKRWLRPNRMAPWQWFFKMASGPR